MFKLLIGSTLLETDIKTATTYTKKLNKHQNQALKVNSFGED